MIRKQLPLQFESRNDLNFEMYLAGDNSEAVNYIRLAVTDPAIQFIYLSGSEGSGRTHLLHASCNEAVCHGKRAVYISLSEYRQFSPSLLKDLEYCDLICIDDLHKIVGCVDWERALIQLFDVLKTYGCTLLVASASPPNRLVHADLQTRLSSGLSYYLKPLSDEQKRIALLQRAQERSLELPKEVVDYLFKNVSRESNYLFTLLDKLDLASLSEQRRLTVPFVRDFLTRSSV